MSCDSYKTYFSTFIIVKKYTFLFIENSFKKFEKKIKTKISIFSWKNNFLQLSVLGSHKRWRRSRHIKLQFPVQLHIFCTVFFSIQRITTLLFFTLKKKNTTQT